MTLWTRWLKYGLVGIVNTGINYGVFSQLLAWRAHYLVAASSGFLTGVATSYVLNRRWTFRCRTAANVAEGSRFVVVNLIALAVFTAVVAICREGFHCSPRAAWVIAIGVSFSVNFFGSEWWAFRPEARAS